MTRNSTTQKPTPPTLRQLSWRAVRTEIQDKKARLRRVIRLQRSRAIRWVLRTTPGSRARRAFASRRNEFVDRSTLWIIQHIATDTYKRGITVYGRDWQYDKQKRAKKQREIDLNMQVWRERRNRPQ